ncbi:MAG: hypothetical protein IH892_15640, partial [Planctomycetes bacterium]|nr:hypothetical protein [Planctomycetota bacterium]
DRIVTSSPKNVKRVAKALVNRGVAKGMRQDIQGAIEDYTAVIEMPDAPVDHVAQALVNRGITKGRQQDFAGAIEDYTAVIELPDAPVDQVAKALVNRGVTKGSQQDIQGEIEDYTAVIELPDAPVDQVAKALVNRGVTKGRQQDFAGAIEDYTAVVELSDAPVDQVAKALFNRGQQRNKKGETDASLADWIRVLGLSGAPSEACVEAANAILHCVIAHPNQKDDDDVTAALNTWLTQLDIKERSARLVELLAALAEPEGEKVWIYAVRRLVQDWAKAPEEFAVFTLVADILDTEDTTKLDPLPPEQRDFALEVMRKFESPEA